MSEFEQALLDRLDRIADALERVAPAETADPVLLALAAKYGRDEFTTREAIAAAADETEAAQAAGLRLPELPHALQQAGIEGAHGLGRFLAGLEGRGVSRIGSDRHGVIWQVVVSRGDETAKAVSILRRLA